MTPYELYEQARNTERLCAQCGKPLPALVEIAPGSVPASWTPDRLPKVCPGGCGHFNEATQEWVEWKPTVKESTADSALAKCTRCGKPLPQIAGDGIWKGAGPRPTTCMPVGSCKDKFKCSSCGEKLTAKNSSRSVYENGAGRCRKCEAEYQRNIYVPCPSDKPRVAEVSVVLRLSKNLLDEIDTKADSAEESRSAFIRRILAEAVK